MLRISVVLGLLAVSCAGNTPSQDLTPVTFMAGFTPQANLPFVGVYVADSLGYFTEAGLDVTIEHSGGGSEHLQLLAAGEVDVTTQDAAVMLERRADPGLPLVSIGLIGQKGQQAFVALEESGIEAPSDWAGRTVGFKGTPPPDLFAILDAVGVDAADVELVNVGFDPRALTEGQVDVYPVFKSNEPDTLEGMGFDLNMWEAADYGAPTLGLAYVATETMTSTEPETLSAFMGAVIRGLRYAEEQPAETIDIVMTHVGEGGDAEHQRFILDTELADAHSALTDTHGLGWQTTEQWQELRDFLITYGALPEPVDVVDAFTTEFLPSLDGAG